MNSLGFDPVWEEIYSQGQELNKYPFDHVMSFVWHHRPSKPFSETKILEIGCGAGNNLWFAAREGFEVTGIDANRSAIDYARRRVFLEGLRADLRLGFHQPAFFRRLFRPRFRQGGDNLRQRTDSCSDCSRNRMPNQTTW